MKIFLGVLLSACGLFAATVDGVVVNGTTGKPQASVIVSLVQPGQTGMQNLASMKSDAAGKFRFDKDYAPGPVLVQALYEGATYTSVLTPGSPTTGITVKVFDTTTKPLSAANTQHMILLEPTAAGLQVSETFLFNNDTQTTVNDPAKGSAEFYLPKPADGKAQIIVNSPGGMPIPRQPVKTGQAEVYKVDYPLKPGETRFDIAYSLPPGDSFTGRNVDAANPVRIVTPSTVTLAGDGIDLLGQEPQTQAHIYNVKAAAFTVKIEGLGSLRDSEQQASPNGQEEDNGAPKITAGDARIYSRFGWVIGLTLTILALGGFMLYRRGTV